MKGLILKDLYNMKSLGPQLIIMLVAFGIAFSGNGMTIFMCVFGSTVCVMSTLSLDEYCNWNMLACVMPVTRRQIVTSKYLAAMLFAAAGVLIGTVMTVIAGLIRSGEQIPSLLLMFRVSGIGIGVGLLIMAAMLPISFKFGVNKGRYVLMGMAAFVAASSALIMKVEDFGGPAKVAQLIGNVNLSLLITGFLAMVAVLVVFSCLLSIRIMEKKEF